MMNKKRKGIAFCVTFALILGTLFSFSTLAFAEDDSELPLEEATTQEAATQEATTVAPTTTLATAMSALVTQGSVKAAATSGVKEITTLGNDSLGEGNNNNRPHKFYKEWVGDDEKNRPTSIQIRVTRTDEDGNDPRSITITLEASNGWYFMTNPNNIYLADWYGSGNDKKYYKYTYTEILPDGSYYEPTVVKHGNSGLVEVTITNTYVGPTTAPTTDPDTPTTDPDTPTTDPDTPTTDPDTPTTTTGPDDPETTATSTAETQFDPSEPTTTEGESIDESTENTRYDGASDLGTTNTLTADNGDANATQTGDDSNMNLFLILIIMAAAAALISIAPTVKKQLNK